MASAPKFGDLLEAFEFASFGGPGENEAYLCKDTGSIHWHTDFGDNEEELPDDIDNADRYIAIPHRTELGLGKPLALEFTKQFLPDALQDVRDIFQRRGAYGRFKDLLDQHALLQQWYDYEAEAHEEALREWCKDRGIAVEGPAEPSRRGMNAETFEISTDRSRSRPNNESKGGTIMPTGSVQLHRVLRAHPERVYRAFLDADAMAKWLPPYGFTCKVHHMDAKVGGTYRMSFTNFTTGHVHSFGGEYRELVPFEKIRYTDKFDDPNLPGEMLTTVALKKVSCGTELNVVQEGLPAAIPLEMCYLGWQESLEQLAKLVEPEIPG